MEIYLTAAGEVACTPPGPADTVAGLVAAVLGFAAGRIDCAACRDTCCAGLPVYADNVFAARLAALALPAHGGPDAALVRRLLVFDPATGRWRLPHTVGRCRFLAAGGRCLIYDIRPLVCRLHLCIPSDPAFRCLKDRLYHAYQNALVAELAGAPSAGNPVAGAAGYDVPIGLVLAWSSGGG